MHFEEAGDYERAVRYLQQAAANAMQRSAYREAIAVSRRGLELLATLPDTDERARQELRLQIALGVPLIATEGYAAPEVGSVYVRAHQLCERLGTTPEISQVFWGLWTFHLLRAELSTALGHRHGIAPARRARFRIRASRCVATGRWRSRARIRAISVSRWSIATKALSLYDPGRTGRRAVHRAGQSGRGRAVLCGLVSLVPRPARSRRRPASGSGRPRADASRSPTVWRMRSCSRRCFINFAARDQWRSNMPTPRWTWPTSMGCCFTGPGADLSRLGVDWEGTAINVRADELRQGLATWQATGAKLMAPHFLTLLAETIPPGQ